MPRCGGTPRLRDGHTAPVAPGSHQPAGRAWTKPCALSASRRPAIQHLDAEDLGERDSLERLPKERSLPSQPWSPCNAARCPVRHAFSVGGGFAPI